MHLASRSQQVVLLAAVTGAVTGLIVAGFDRVVVGLLLDHLLELDPWILAIAPGIGLLAAYLARHFVGDRCSPSTADDYLLAFHRRAHAPRAARLRGAHGRRRLHARLGRADGHGGSIDVLRGDGRVERAASLAASLPRRRSACAPGGGRGGRRGGDLQGAGDRRRIRLGGAVPRRPGPADAAAGTRRRRRPATWCSSAINGTGPLFPIEGSISFSIRDLVGAVALGVIAGIGARAFAWLLRRAKRLQSRGRPVVMMSAAAASLAVLFVAVRLLTGESLIVGVRLPRHRLGIATRACAVVARRGPRAVGASPPSATVAGGGVGGLFVPLVVAGALDRRRSSAGFVNDADLRPVHRGRRRRLPRSRLPSPTRRGDVRRRDDRPAVVRGARPVGGSRRRADDGSRCRSRPTRSAARR